MHRIQKWPYAPYMYVHYMLMIYICLIYIYVYAHQVFIINTLFHIICGSQALICRHACGSLALNYRHVYAYAYIYIYI